MRQRISIENIAGKQTRRECETNSQHLFVMHVAQWESICRGKFNGRQKKHQRQQKVNERMRQNYFAEGKQAIKYSLWPFLVWLMCGEKEERRRRRKKETLCDVMPCGHGRGGMHIDSFPPSDRYILFSVYAKDLFGVNFWNIGAKDVPLYSI